jgi:hypothetical protein
MTAQAATQTGSTCGECGVIFSTESPGKSGSVSLGYGEGQNIFQIYYVVEPCPLHAQAEATAKERDALREFAKSFACDCADLDEHDCAPEAEEARELLEEWSAAAQPKHAATKDGAG